MPHEGDKGAGRGARGATGFRRPPLRFDWERRLAGWVPAAPLAPVEPLEDMGQLVRGDTRAGIGDADLDAPVGPEFRLDDDHASLRRVAQDVGKEIVMDLAEAGTVGEHRRPAGWRRRTDGDSPLVHRQGADAGHRRVDRLAKGDGRRPQGQRGPPGGSDGDEG